MPCDQVRLTSVELSGIEDHDLLETALKGTFKNVYRSGNVFSFTVNGYDNVNLENGRLTSSLSKGELQKVVGQIKQAYAGSAVQQAALRFGWMVQGANKNDFEIKSRF